jgi:hypothetical protein
MLERQQLVTPVNQVFYFVRQAHLLAIVGRYEQGACVSMGLSRQSACSSEVFKGGVHI